MGVQNSWYLSQKKLTKTKNYHGDLLKVNSKQDKGLNATIQHTHLTGLISHISDY